jgi:hypothetical protein
MARLSELLFGRVVALKQFHLNQWFAKTLHQRSRERSLRQKDTVRTFFHSLRSCAMASRRTVLQPPPPPQCRYTRRKIPPSLSYVTERGEWKMDRKDKGDYTERLGGFFPYALLLVGLALPPRQVCVHEDWRCFATFIRQYRHSELDQRFSPLPLL